MLHDFIFPVASPVKIPAILGVDLMQLGAKAGHFSRD
jgi:hypothetical protein